MDFGIKGKWVLVCVSLKGLGCGCVEVLVEVGVDLVMNVCGLEVLEVMV